ncbi:hypothetical protein OIK40_14440 [Erythrobacter sp. sf7]|uniref:Uncharacterized protein n=1 Tax=Erythrobacter fulvus TaxID=2987523 RepID=A0ABT5JSZ9_9SPHN|nr:hypothetical protein [Erythrobacter fulvus]MDC8755844.1 hypothetical protein [Erythrobacter fulvus]
MIRAIRQIEALPETYAAVTGTDEADLPIIWQRIEHHIAYRYSPREVVWHLKADEGEWLPPLAPIIAISAAHEDQTPVGPESGPMGGYLLAEGHSTITATVGAGPVPEVVAEAARRLSRYLRAESELSPGVSRISSGALSLGISRREISPAMALQNSGAADLLRAYRRV